MSRPLNPPPQEGPLDGDLPAYISNGLIGLRVREMPFMAGVAMLNGVAGEHPIRRVEASLPVPYPLAADLSINGVRLSDQPWCVSELRQAYDFSAGELTSTFVFKVRDIQAQVEVLTFASRSAPALILQEIVIQTSRSCDLAFCSIVDVDGIRGKVLRRRTATPGEAEPVCDGSLLWEAEGGISSCGIAVATEIVTPHSEKDTCEWDATGPLATTYEVRTSSGKVRFRQIAAMIPSVFHNRADEEAVRRVARGRKLGFDGLRSENREAWDQLWKSRIVIHGASEEHQALVDAAFYYLNASVHPASPSSTSIFGLANWHDYHYYYGHVMWDIDAFCVPPVLLVQPSAARSLLNFRSRGLDAARANARLASRDGLQFPWQSAPLTGQEAAPGDGAAAAHEDHGSLHTARAFSLFADVSGDRTFLEEKAWPVLSGVADWAVSRVTKTKRGYEMLKVMGPAEVPDPPDNDAFTLMGVHDVLKRSIRAAESLNREAPERWREVFEGLYLPRRSDGAIPSHDDFRIDEDKGATPSPLAGLFPLDYPATERERRATLGLFLRHWREYIGAPMLPALYGVWAAMAGDRELALELFKEGYAAYDHSRFHQCLEYRSDFPDSETDAGPFFANLGGMLIGLLYGYSGLVIDDGSPAQWPRRPVVLPSGWQSIEVERVWVRGREASLVARHGADRAELTFVEAHTEGR